MNSERTAAGRPAPLGSLLRRWRRLRGKSQLDLALSAQVSPRHLSYVENGRAQPGRELLLALARALELPLRARNDLLERAGFARAFRESGVDARELAGVRQAIELLLARHEPFPAVVLDRLWNVGPINGGARRLFAWLLPGGPPVERPNLLRAMFDPAGLRPLVEDWETVAAALLSRVRTEAAGGVPDEELAALYEELRAIPGAPRDPGAVLDAAPPGPLVAVTFVRGERRLSFFSALTTLGTPRDVTVQELRLEHFFPADESTARALESGVGEMGLEPTTGSTQSFPSTN